MTKKNPEDKKQRIINAAIKIISEKGYHGASTALIAKKAGVSQGIIFHYFGNKEGLFFSLLKGKSKMFREEFEKSVGGEKNALKKIKIAALSYARLVQKEEKFYGIVIKQIMGSGLDPNRITKYVTMETYNLIKELIEEGIKQGVLREIDPEVATTCLFGMMNYNALRWMVFGKNFSLDEAAKKTVDIFLRGIAKS